VNYSVRQSTLDNFKVELINLHDLQLSTISEADIDFYEVEGYPVIDIFDGKTGPVALDGTPRTFPSESLYGYNGRQLSKDEFFTLFPDTKVFFKSIISEQQAA